MTTDHAHRIQVLNYALTIEKLTSQFLGHLLGIHDHRNSRILGNKSSALSFNQKIDLLIDIGALDNEMKSKFQAFMEIRNQLMHNADANSFEACFSFLDKKKEFLFKCYPQNKDLSVEDKLTNSVKLLCDELLLKVNDIFKLVENKVRKQVELEIASKSHKSIFEALEDIIQNYDALCKSMQQRDPNFESNPERIKVLLLLTNVWRQKLDSKI